MSQDGDATEQEVTAADRPGDAPLEIGARVDRYTVLDRVGEGGAGEVYAAYDPKLDRKVALKVLRLAGKEHEARLFREAQAMARLSHPNVVAVYDTGLVGERLFLAMEFVPGGTLRKWQRAATRTPRETLEKYLQAGRGLAAAHAAGLIHRDFKPDNVLIAEDGDCKVSDFGIVRAITTPAARTDPDPEEPQAGPPTHARRGEPQTSTAEPARDPDATASLDAPMTEEGHLLGTPGYMAPEQYLFEPVDERTDQFAFSVSLYEALYGERPFGGRGVFELGSATVAGKVKDAPKGTLVPARVRRVLLRGLSAERDKRYPSLPSLLSDLARDPTAQRRRALSLVALGLAVVGGIVGVTRVMSSRTSALCSGSEEAAREVWSPDVQARIEHAMLATALPFAEDSWRRTHEQIEGFMARWKAMHTETCQATRIRGEQSVEVMSARMACLEQERRAVGALALVLGTADRDVASHAVEAAMALPPLERCNDVTSLTAVEPEPTDSSKRRVLDATRRTLASVSALFESGRVAPAREEVLPLVEAARALGYRPLLAEVLLESARVKAEAGASRDASMAEATEALFQADVGRADALRARAATLLMAWTTDAGHRADTERWSQIAGAALDRIHDDGDDRAQWLVARATALELQGKYREAADQLALALALARRAGSSPARVADTERLLAGKLAAIGDMDEAERLVTEASESIRRAVGDKHPSRIPYLFTAGYVAGERGDYERGLATTREAEALAEGVSPDHSRLPQLYNNESNFLYELGDYNGALVAAEKTVAAGLRLYGSDSVHVAYGYSDAGKALLAIGRDEEASRAYERAVAIHEKSAEEEPDLVEALVGSARARTRAGKAATSIPLLERALGLMTKTDRTGMEGQRLTADAEYALAQALWESGSRSPRVGELARAALETERSTKHADVAREIEKWMAARSLAPSGGEPHAR